MKLLVGSTRVHAPGGLAVTSPAAAWSGDTDGVLREPFLDEEHISALSGVTRGVNLPTKDAGNPLFLPAGANSDTWDYQKLMVSVVKDGATWRMFYAGANVSGSVETDVGCYATSTDGVTFTKPDLGGDNIIIDGRLTSCRWYPDLEKWVATVERRPSLTARMWIYSSDDPDSGWTLVNTIDPGSASEGKDLVQSEDGRWLAYFSTDHALNRRKIIAWRSATTALDSTFSSVGTVLSGPSSTDQRYSLGVERQGEIHYGLLQRYNSTAEQTVCDLYVGRDGLAWRLVTLNFIGLGSSGAFDDELIFSANRIVEDGNTCYVYYCGSPVKHDAGRPKDMRVGRVSWPKGRIGKVSSTGTVTTVPLIATVGQALHVNCDASGGGKIEVEVLTDAGAAITGYAQANATDITTDTFDITAAWTGGALPTGTPIRLRFHLTSAVLHYYEIR